ncbi:hypothetical protein [Nesterenkonia sp. HG001]|uniref:hypothetical protein n=1 Tax=Nesterenkonia sp. HG001 TaxID=2983207 RepID=UPI002AC5F6B4|nr:hypothetical protein [Nesterenkonia sp. HG001]MDZ5077153.1 hypothetical protein [Nesterenkonia sp. HG001]
MTQPPGGQPGQPHGSQPHGQPPYGPSQSGHAQPFQYPPYSAPAPKPTRGPLAMVLIVLGSVLLAGAVGLFVMAALMFTQTVPLGVLDRSGGPGSDAVFSGEPPITVEVQLDAEESYLLYVASPSGSSTPRLADVPEVTAPSGESRTMGPAQISSTASMGGTDAVGQYSYTAHESGLHTVEIEAFADPGPFAEGESFIVIAPGGDFVGLMGGVFGVLGSVFGGIAAGTIGLGLLVAGIIVAVIRRRRRREHAAWPAPGAGPAWGPPQG